MDHAAKAKFILALHKHSLQAFDSGGFAGDTNAVGGIASGSSQGATNLFAPSTSASNNTAGPGGTTLNATNPNTSGIAGNIGNFLGTNNNFQASGANIQAGTNQGQINQAYNGAQYGLQGQNQFAQQAYGQNGFGNQSNVFAQQQALANQLQNQANGQGPNPAQAALNQATGQNVSNQGALMAGQRGASSNAGLIARQSAQQGAATQQQAVGQSATLQAQQQIAAQQALQNQQAQMQAVATNQIAAQGQGANNLSSAAQNEQNILQGANTAYNNAGVSMQGNINSTNSQTSAANQNANQNVIGGLLSGASAIGSLFAEGGEVDTGTFKPTQPDEPATPSPAAGNLPALASNPMTMAPSKGDSGGGGGGGGGAGALALLAAAKGGRVPSNPNGPQSFAGQWLNTPARNSSMPMSLYGMAKGGKIEPKLAAKGGGVKAMAKGEKAVKKDNSYANDKVPALLSEGEIVLPRSVTEHPNAPAMAARFVSQVMAKRRLGKK